MRALISLVILGRRRDTDEPAVRVSGSYRGGQPKLWQSVLLRRNREIVKKNVMTNRLVDKIINRLVDSKNKC